MSDEDCKSISSSRESDWSDAEDEVYEFQAFHDDKIFDTLPKMLDHEREQHSFDLQALRKDLKLDLYGTIRVVNAVRLNKSSAQEITSTITQILETEKFLQPTLENDAVLFHLVDEDDDEDIIGSSSNHRKPENEELYALQKKYAALESQHALLQASVRASIDARESKEDKPDNDSYYFDSYSYNDIHETMLKDTVRTDAYRDAIYDNKDVFKDKIVLDVGCGTGILSLFCAKAGARHVYAIDNSSIIDKARSNAHENGCDDKITFVKGKVEEISLPVKQVDIIISEWMGYALLYESMLDSVLVARDRFLSPSGLMMPSCTTLVVAGISDADYVNDRVHFWNDVYGFRMPAMKDGIFDHILVDALPASSLGTNSTVLTAFNTHAVTVSDLIFKRPFQLTCLSGQSTIYAFSIWFDTFFTRTREELPASELIEGSVKTKNGNAFSTGPHGLPTHWKQAVLLVDGEITVPDKHLIVGEIEYRKGQSNPRFLEVIVSWSVVAQNLQVNGKSASKSQAWHLS